MSFRTELHRKQQTSETLSTIEKSESLMQLLAFLLPLLAALACLTLSRLVPTRLCGLAAAFLVLGAAMSLALVDLQVPLFATPWLNLTGIQESARWIAVGALAGSGLGLAMVALALPSDMRGFGLLPALLAVLPLVSLLALRNTVPTQLAMTGMLAVVLAIMTLRVADAGEASPGTLLIGLAGATGALLLIIATILTRTEPGSALVIGCMFLAGMLLTGVAPFQTVARALSDAPAGVGVVLLCSGPALVGAWTLSSISTIATGSPRIQVLFVILGLLALAGGAAGALATDSLRHLVGWQYGASIGLVMIAAAFDKNLALQLLLTTQLTTLAAGLALAFVERRAGTADLNAIEYPGPLVGAGFAIMIAAAASLGLPGTPGFWARLGLAATLTTHGAGWALGLVLAGSGLLVLSYATPLGLLWRRRPVSDTRSAAPFWPQVVPLVAAGLILLLSLVALPGVAQPGLGIRLQSISPLIGLLAMAELVRRIAWQRHTSDPDEQAAGAAHPAALAESIAALAWLAAPESLLQLGWMLLVRVATLVRWLIAWIEERYYLAGLTVALIIALLLFI